MVSQQIITLLNRGDYVAADRICRNDTANSFEKLAEQNWDILGLPAPMTFEQLIMGRRALQIELIQVVIPKKQWIRREGLLAINAWGIHSLNLGPERTQSRW